MMKGRIQGTRTESKTCSFLVRQLTEQKMYVLRDPPVLFKNRLFQVALNIQKSVKKNIC